MIRKVQVDDKIVEIFYKDGVEQTRKNADLGVENIPITDQFKDQIKVILEQVNGDTEALNTAWKEDDNYRPRVCIFGDNGKPLLVQNNVGIPREYWNIEMYRFEIECSVMYNRY